LNIPVESLKKNAEKSLEEEKKKQKSDDRLEKIRRGSTNLDNTFITD
jgi:hypothetical protein